MEETRTFAGVKKEGAITLTNNNQAKKLALLSILETGSKYENT